MDPPAIVWHHLGAGVFEEESAAASDHVGQTGLLGDGQGGGGGKDPKWRWFAGLTGVGRHAATVKKPGNGAQLAY